MDVLLEAASGEVGDASFKLRAPFGRMIIYEAKNGQESWPNDKVRQLIYKNQSMIGFNFSDAAFGADQRVCASSAEAGCRRASSIVRR